MVRPSTASTLVLCPRSLVDRIARAAFALLGIEGFWVARILIFHRRYSSADVDEQVKDTSEDPVYLDPGLTGESKEFVTLLIVVFVEHWCPLHDIHIPCSPVDCW